MFIVFDATDDDTSTVVTCEGVGSTYFTFYDDPRTGQVARFGAATRPFDALTNHTAALRQLNSGTLPGPTPTTAR